MQTHAMTYPCKDCRATAPVMYCTPCRTEYDRRHRMALDLENVKVRARRKRKRDARSATCATCGEGFKGKRADARFCSDTCRQKAHRKSVTDIRRDSIGPASYP